MKTDQKLVLLIMPEMYNMDLEKGVTFCLLSIKTLILVLYNFSIAFSIPICMLSM